MLLYSDNVSLIHTDINSGNILAHEVTDDSTSNSVGISATFILEDGSIAHIKVKNSNIAESVLQSLVLYKEGCNLFIFSFHYLILFFREHYRFPRRFKRFKATFIFLYVVSNR